MSARNLDRGAWGSSCPTGRPLAATGTSDGRADRLGMTFRSAASAGGSGRAAVHDGVGRWPDPEVCCRQFGVPQPAPENIPIIARGTDCLPLLVETVIGLRRFVGTYEEAVRIFPDRGGDDARRYLYQREYDQLDPGGRSKQVLAAFLLLGEPVAFATLTGLLSRLTKLQVADALSETGSVFLSTFEDEAGETLYQLVPPSVPFVRLVSERLPYFTALRSTVDHFRTAGARATPREAALIVTMERALRDRAYALVAEAHAGLSAHDPALANPKIRALLGQAYAELGQAHRTAAREWFRAAEAMGYLDPFMMRRWYNLEIEAGDDLSVAERICRSVIGDKRFGARHRSEFLSKLGRCLLQQANGLGAVKRDRASVLVRQSCAAYLEALWAGRNVRDLDLGETLTWLERPLDRLLRLSAEDAEQFYLLLEEVAAVGHDLHPDGAELLVDYLLKLPLRPERAFQTRLMGLCTRTAGRIGRAAKPADAYPSQLRLVDTLGALRSNLARQRPPPARRTAGKAESAGGGSKAADRRQTPAGRDKTPGLAAGGACVRLAWLCADGRTASRTSSGEVTRASRKLRPFRTAPRSGLRP